MRSRVDSGRKALRRPEYVTSQRATTSRMAADRTVHFGQYGPRGEVLRPGQDAGGVGVRVLTLQVVVVRVDDLVVEAVPGVAEGRAEVPRALVAVLVADEVVPRVPLLVGDRLVVLVADDVDRRVGLVVVRVLADVAGRRNRVRIGLVRIERDRGAAPVPAVVGAVLAERAVGRVVAAPDAPRREEQEERRRVRDPALPRLDRRDLVLQLGVAQADGRLRDRVGAAARRERRRVDDRAGERGAVP